MKRLHRAAIGLALTGIAWSLTGSQVQAGEPARRIVTLAPHLAELSCDAGACARLVGVSRFSDFPDSVRSLPIVGDGFSVSYEGVLARHPDLVLAWSGGTPAAAVDRLRGLGLRVEWISVERLGDIAQALEQLGDLLGTSAKARSAADAFRTRLASQRARWHAAAPIRVAYQIGTSPTYVIGGRSPISDALSVCGGVNVFAGVDQAAVPTGAESLLAAQADAVIYGGEDGEAGMRAFWARLPTSKVETYGSLYAVNADWLSRPTPRMLDGIEQLCAALDDARLKLKAKPAANAN